METATISGRISTELLGKVDTLCSQTNLTRSYVVGIALNKFMDALEKKPKKQKLT